MPPADVTPRPSLVRAFALSALVLVATVGASLTLVRFVESGAGPDDAHAEPGRDARTHAPRVLAGSGSNLLLTRRLTDAFVAAGGAPLVVEPDSIGTGGGLRALHDTVIDGALASRPLTDAERRGTRSRVYAHTAVVLATTARTSFRRDELLAIFEGRNTDVTPLLRELGDSGVSALREVWPELAAAHDDAVRAHRFEVLYTDDAMARALDEVDHAIGIFDRAQLRLRRMNATPIELEGLSVSKELSLVVREDDDTLDDFARFLTSDAARAVIVDAGYEAP